MNIGSLFPALQMVKPEARSEATSAREERRQALADARLSDARAAVESLKQRSSSASEEKKAAAKKKIEEIKARLQMLQMAMIGDPKGAARMAAALARELGAAVKAYAAAGGSTAGLGAASGAPATGGSEAAPESASVEVSAETSSAEAPAEGQDGVTAEAAKASNPYQQAIDASQARINEQARRSSERQADRDTMDEVKRLAARIKAMAQRAKDSPEGDEAERAVAGMDREVQAALRAMPDVGVALTI
jgi:ribosome-associated translation inhibitor RaiA